MKTILAIFLLFVAPLHAIGLTFEWDAAPADFEVTSYNIYERVDASTTRLIGNSPTPEFTIANVTPGARQYEVTLVNLWGESLVYALGTTPAVLPPLKPGKIKFRAVAIQASADKQTWETVALVDVPELPGRKFYQLAFHP